MLAERAIHWVVVLVMTSHVARMSGQLDSPHLPWRTTLERRADSEDSQANQCRLPPYPERGGYVVVDAPGAGPGDVYQNVSLVRYEEDIYDRLYLKLLRCSFGRWSEYIFQYHSEKLYFNVSWCPLLCPPGEGARHVHPSLVPPSSFSSSYQRWHQQSAVTCDFSGRLYNTVSRSEVSQMLTARSPFYSTVTAPTPATTTEPHETFEETSPNLCKLPTNPDREGYDTRYTMFGHTYERFDVHQYVLDEVDGVYKVMDLECENGQWDIRFWNQIKTESLPFNTYEWCPFLCATTMLKVDSEPAKQPYLPNIKITEENTKNQTKCELPPYPQDGNYTVMHRPAAAPGDVLGAAHLSYSCSPNRKLVGSKDVYCIEGAWSDDAPKCIHNTTAVTQSVLSFFAECGSIRSMAVERTSAEDAARRELPWHVALYDKQRAYERICSGSIIATNLVVTGEYFRNFFAYQNNVYSYDVEICAFLRNSSSAKLEKGKNYEAKYTKKKWIQALQEEEELICKKYMDKFHHELNLYKVNETVRLLCNEELEFVNATVFVGITLDNRLQWGPHITAHCFGSGAEDSQPASRFVVAAGKARGAWSDAADEHAQTSDVAEVIIHPRYRGKETSYQNNIALIFLNTPLNYTDYVMSVCIDFDLELDEKQLDDGSLGKIASWGSASKNGTDISKLKVDWTTYVDTNKCISNSSPSLLKYITSDKICAGDAKGTTLCKSDGGGSLSYHVWDDDGSRVNYLRGVASIAPADERSCNVDPIGVFTHVLHHKSFLVEYLKEAVW
ncbi:Melanization protease 1 [Eumeta japonica]|uniref:Melanization protease 1 n=1 Tax=Eumeta variegata TaxID=151549 RepID=A0A4C1UVX5_EUMVA|nr:Melanization protease 1 [Eumeta japonica]